MKWDIHPRRKATDSPVPHGQALENFDLNGLLSGQPVFMGISLSSVRRVSKKVLARYCSLLGKRSGEFIVVIADVLEAFNYETERGLSPEEAYRKAIHVGRQFADGYRKLSKTFPFLRVICLSEFFDQTPVQARLGILNEEYLSNERFRDEVHQQIALNRSRGTAESQRLSDPRYLLAEYSVMFALYEGLLGDQPAQIALVEDQLFEKIVSGTFSELASRLGVGRQLYPYFVISAKGHSE